MSDNLAKCIPWDSWANITNKKKQLAHLYIFLVMFFREWIETYSISVYSVRVLILVTIPLYLSAVIYTGYALRGHTKRHEGWEKRWIIANPGDENPCFVAFGNSKEWLWTEILILYMNLVYLIVFMFYKKLRYYDRKQPFASLLKDMGDQVDNHEEHQHELTVDTEYNQVLFSKIKKPEVHGIKGLEIIDFSHTCDLDNLLQKLKTDLNIKPEEQKLETEDIKVGILKEGGHTI